MCENREFDVHSIEYWIIKVIYIHTDEWRRDINTDQLDEYANNKFT